MTRNGASTQRAKRTRYRLFLRHVERQLIIFRAQGAHNVVFALEHRRATLRRNLGLRPQPHVQEPPLQPTTAAMQPPHHPPATPMDMESMSGISGSVASVCSLL